MWFVDGAGNDSRDEKIRVSRTGGMLGALRNSATPAVPFRWRIQLRDVKSEIRNPKSEIYVAFARRENITTKMHNAASAIVPMISPGMPSKA